jgi:GNAT superfamily N-acetyltransferase
VPARHLPADPHLEHLRNEAKILQRLVRAADPETVAAVREFHPRLTEISTDPADLAGFSRADAQLVVARRYGFASWNRLRQHVDVIIRPISSLAELAAVFDVVGAQAVPPITCADRRHADQERRFPDDRAMMLVAEYHGQIIGGGFAFRRGSSPSCRTATLRNVAVQPVHHGQQLERRLIEKIEQGAISLGVGGIILGGPRGAEREFFLSMGYRGRHEGGFMGKELPRSVLWRYPDGWHHTLDELRQRRASRLAARSSSGQQ